MTSLIPADSLLQLQKRCPCRQIQLYQLATYYNNHFPSPPILVAHGLAHTGKLNTILSLLEITKISHTLIRSRECLSQRHLLTKIFSACMRSLAKEKEEYDSDNNDNDSNIEPSYDRLDSINALLNNLKKLFKTRRTTSTGKKFVVIIDEINKQKGTTYALLPALARLGNEIPGLSVLLISGSIQPLQLHRVGVPYVYFAPYTRKEAIQIIITSTPSTALQPETLPVEFPDTVSNTTLEGIYEKFVTAVYDTLTVHTSSTSLPGFRRTCEKLWPRFVWPMLVGEPIPSRNNNQQHMKTTWDFARLLVHNRSLFQIEGEKALLDTLNTDSKQAWTFDDLLAEYKANALPQTTTATTITTSSQSTHTPLFKQTKLPSQDITPQQGKDQAQSKTLLKFFPTLLLLSSYLASHTQPKHDIILFSRLSSSSSHKRRYLSSTLNRSKTIIRRTPTKSKSSLSSRTTTSEDNNNNDTHNTGAGGGVGMNINNTTPSQKRNKAVTAELDIGTTTTTSRPNNNGSGSVSTTGYNYSKEKLHKSSRLLFQKTSSIPKSFTLERVIAILRAIHPDGVSNSRGFGKGKGGGIIADRVYGEMAELERLRFVVRAAAGGAAGSNNGGDYGGGSRNDDGGGGGGGGWLEEKWRVNVGREVVVGMGGRWGVGVDGWEID